jgi:hypothetical protein
MPGAVDCWQDCVRSVQRALYTLGSVHSEGGCSLLKCVRPGCTVFMFGMLAHKCCG